MSGAKISVRILGCGSSGGVPRIGQNWGQCDPHEPRNRRLRCSVLVQRHGPDGATTDVLVDTSPDMREQLLAADVGRLDAVLYTHDHADQANGIDDLRQICYAMKRRVPVYMDEATSSALTRRFAYCFEQAQGSSYPAILQAHNMPPPGETFFIDGPGGTLPVQAFNLEHGAHFHALGFRFGGFRSGNLAYCPDVSALPEASLPLLQGLDLWIVDALRREPHPTHAHLQRTLHWIEQLRPKHAILTNMHISLDYASLKQELPTGVEPGWDGLTVEFVEELPEN